MNTRICYLYRDSDNYKVHNMCVIHGELTDSQIDQILECCDMGEYFIPSQVGLPGSTSTAQRFLKLYPQPGGIAGAQIR